MPYFDFEGKQIYYNEAGEGTPLLLMHGNSVSSNMFRHEIKYFSKDYRVIVFDYAGMGRSSRLEKLTPGFWNFNGRTALALLELLNIDKAYVIGTSGGALSALNMAALDCSKIIKLIADSFLGLRLSEDEGNTIADKRTRSKKSFMSRAFWKSMHGDDWEFVADQDIALMRETGRSGQPLISGDLSSISCDVLLVGSTQDEIIPDMEARMKEVCRQLPRCRNLIFKYGKHPFMITQRKTFHQIVHKFFSES